MEGVQSNIITDYTLRVSHIFEITVLWLEEMWLVVYFRLVKYSHHNNYNKSDPTILMHWTIMSNPDCIFS